MGEGKTIKEIYNLDYDTKNIGYGLPDWYNRLLDKTIDELIDLDLGRMVRQNILKELAIDKLIEKILIDPTSGELWENEFIEYLTENIDITKKSKLFNKLIAKLPEIKNDIDNFEWDEEEDKKDFENKVDVLIQKIQE